MRNFLFLTLLCAGLCGASCSDKDDDDNGGYGPAGSAEMLVGTWGISHMYVEAMGEHSDQDVDASISTFTFRSDGTATESQQGATAYATWSYNPQTRLLRVVDSNFGTVYNWNVRSLTEQQLIFDFTIKEEGIEMFMIWTYDRITRSSSLSASSEAPVAEPAPLCGRAKDQVELKAE